MNSVLRWSGTVVKHAFHWPEVYVHHRDIQECKAACCALCLLAADLMTYRLHTLCLVCSVRAVSVGGNACLLLLGCT